MNLNDYKNVDNYIRETWFKDHKAKYSQMPDIGFEMILWKKPETSNYLLIYMRIPNYLFIGGDVGEAVYCSGMKGLKEWAECDIGYFAGKCVASEDGRGYQEWDSDFLEKRIKEALKEHSDKTWEDFCQRDGHTAINNEHEWTVWLSRNADDFWGADPYCWPTDGKRTAVRCRGHLIGLKMAIRQLEFHSI